MKLLRTLVCTFMAITVFEGLRAFALPTITVTTSQDSTTTITTNVQSEDSSVPAPIAAPTTTLSTTTSTPISITTVTSVLELIPTTNSLGISTTISTIIRSEASTQHPPPTPFLSSLSSTTATDSDTTTTFTTTESSTTIVSSSTPPTASTTVCLSPNQNDTSGGPASNCTLTTLTSSKSKGTRVALASSVPVVVLLVLIILIVRWRSKRDPFLKEPEEQAAWWVHPIYNFRRLLLGADRHTPRRTQPRVVFSRQPLPDRPRPMISNPMPIYPGITIPPPQRPVRPFSLTESLMEDMSTVPSPQLRTKSPQELAAVDEKDALVLKGHVDTDDDDNHRSLSPRPLRVEKAKATGGPSGSGLETSDSDPVSTRSLSNNYSTLFAGPSQMKPVYLPYRKPDSPPPSKLARRNFLPYPTNDQQCMESERPYQPPRFADEDENDIKLKRLRREEALRMLEENAGPSTMERVEKAQETTSPTGQHHFDFIGQRARKVLEDKRRREDFERNRGAQQHNAPPVPEFPAPH